MKNVLLFLTLTFYFSNCFSQLENKNWCFMSNTKVTFNSPTPTISNSSISFNQNLYGGGSSSVSDALGNLLFYTDGIKVWDKNNNIMPNGSYIGGGVDNHWSQQTVVIVPKPLHPNLYYIFVVNDYDNYSSFLTNGKAGVFYSVVNMDLNNGNGDLVLNQISIPLKNHLGVPIEYDYFLQTGPQVHGQRITSSLNNTEDKIWLTLSARFSNGSLIERFNYSYLISNNGINEYADGTSPVPTTTTILSNSYYPIANNTFSDFFGFIKISPDGKYLGEATGDGVRLFNFNNQNGSLSFNRTIYNSIFNSNGNNINAGYGIEFSPNSNFLYFNTYDGNLYQEYKSNRNNQIKIVPEKEFNTKRYVRIYQVPVETKTNKVLEIGSFLMPEENNTNIINPVGYNVNTGTLQLALDGKIYVCSHEPFTPIYSKLGAIKFPNISGIGCNYVNNEIDLFPNHHEGSLPQWIHSTKGEWPKAYVGKQMGILTKLNNQNIIAYYASNYELNNGGNMTPNINHNGVLPSTPSSNEQRQYSLQYNSQGITNWTKTDLFPIIKLSNGTMQMGRFNNDIGPSIVDIGFFDINTGTPTSGPVGVPNGNRILAETNSGSIISLDSYYNLFVSTSTSVTSGIPSGLISNGSFKFIFNPISNKLFSFFQVYNGEQFLRVYNISNNSISLLVEKQLQQNQFPNTGLVVNNNDEVFIQSELQFYQIDYSGTNLNAVYNLVSIQGITNTNFNFSESNNPYTDDFCVLNKTSTINGINKILILNLQDFSVKQIDAVNCQASSYLIVGDYVYLGVNTRNISSFSIGGIQINQLIVNKWQMNLFKFKLSTAFNKNLSVPFTSIEKINSNLVIPSVEIIITPNPSTSTIRINLTDSKKQNFYTVKFINKISNVEYLKRNYLSGSLIEISTFQKGLYFIELKDTYGNCYYTKFLKQ